MKNKYLLAFLFVLLVNIMNSQDEIINSCGKSRIKNFNRHINYRSSGNQDDFDITYMKLNLDVIPSAKKIVGIVDIYCKSLKDGLNKLDFDLLNLLKVTSTRNISDEVLSFSHSDDILSIDLSKGYAFGEIVKVRIKYSGQPGGSFHFDTKDGAHWLWTKTEPYGSKEWFPCKNLPDDKTDSLDMVITVPDDLYVVSNGILTDTIRTGNKLTFYWKERYPIVSYLISLAIHPYKIRTDYFKYTESDSMPVYSYIVPSNFDKNSEKYGIVPEMLKAFTQYYGEYPFIKEKYGNAEFPWGGGMEHQTVTSLLGPYEFLLAHELAHQWWGDNVTCNDFHHIWLNEGFATYSEALWDEYSKGTEALHKKMKKKEYLGNGTVYVEDITNPGEIFDGSLSYNKGSWVLHMLRHVVGDDKFFEILKAYGNDKKYSVATTEDFKAMCEQISGKNLSSFFDQWIYGDFHPVYLYDWSYSEESGKYIVHLNVEQFQLENLFEMPIDINITTEAGEENFVINNKNKLQGYDLIVDSKPTSLTLDKDNWILNEVRESISLINQDNNELKLTLTNFGSFGFDKPDGFGNGLIYQRSGKNVLFFGSLMFGNSDDYVVDNSEKGSHKDFKKLEDSKIEINKTTISDLDINVKYTDTNHPNSKKIIIDQTSYSWQLDPNRDFIILNYKLINNGSEDLNDFYVSQFMDFDIGDYLENYVAKDETRSLLYQKNKNVYVGISSLDKLPKVNYSSVAGAVDILDENKKYQYLTATKNDYKENKQNDWSTMLSVGPYDFKVGDTLTVNFALVAGTSKADIQLNADMAQTIFDKLITDNQEVNIFEKENTVFVYPNPITDKINFNFFLNDSQNINIGIFDLTGKKVYSFRQFQQKGHSSLTLNKILADGMYFYKIDTKSGVLTGKIVCK